MSRQPGPALRLPNFWLVIVLLALLAAAAAAALLMSRQPRPPDPLAALPERRWTMVAGEVVARERQLLLLASREGRFRVEMDDWDPAYMDSAMLRIGDRVVVTGAVDRDGPHGPGIEAHSIYIPALGLFLRASAADEEAAGRDSGDRPPAATI